MVAYGPRCELCTSSSGCDCFRYRVRPTLDAQAERTERGRLLEMIEGQLRDLWLRNPTLDQLRRLSNMLDRLRRE